MKILHYFLGFPPYRTGGLTKYASDLMKSQVEDGHIVMALWPGAMLNIYSKTYIKRKKNHDGIINFEIVNPLPVSLDEGINDFVNYTKPGDLLVYKRFLNEKRPQVIHIHTLMGLHKEFVDCAKELNIKTVYTTHDYFGICSKVTLYRYGEVCENDHGCIDCIQCNLNALSINKIRVMQSPLYRSAKNSFILKWLRKYHRKKFFDNDSLTEMPSVESKEISEKYMLLRKYYLSILENMDFIHFNSTVTEKVFNRYMKPNRSRVISITHKDIPEKCHNLNWEPSEQLRIVFLSPAKPFKGFNILKEVLDELWYSGNCNFVLKVFGDIPKKEPYMIINENGYVYDDLYDIFAECDVLVAPSVWYETFGFTVLEALSYGVPVIVSDNVGAKDIVNNCGIVVKANSKTELKDAICSFSTETQMKLRKNMQEYLQIKNWEKLKEEMYSVYQDIING